MDSVETESVLFGGNDTADTDLNNEVPHMAGVVRAAVCGEGGENSGFNGESDHGGGGIGQNKGQSFVSHGRNDGRRNKDSRGNNGGRGDIDKNGSRDDGSDNASATPNNLTYDLGISEDLRSLTVTDLPDCSII